MSLIGDFTVGEKVVVKVDRDEFMDAVVDSVRSTGYNVRIAQTYNLDGSARHRPLLFVPFEARYELFRGELK